jgi:hypothetical protein
MRSRRSYGGRRKARGYTTEATEEAIYNAILRATTVSSARGVLEALPLERTPEILERYGALGQDRIGGGG